MVFVIAQEMTKQTSTVDPEQPPPDAGSPNTVKDSQSPSGYQLVVPKSRYVPPNVAKISCYIIKGGVVFDLRDLGAENYYTT